MRVIKAKAQSLPDIGNVESQEYRDVHLTIEGLELATGEPGKFVLYGVPVVKHPDTHVDALTFRDNLVETGRYDRRDADDAIEAMYEFLEAREMGRVLAERVKRVVIPREDDDTGSQP